MVGETLTVDVGLPIVNNLATPWYMDLRLFEESDDAARFVALNNPAGLELAGGVRMFHIGGGYMRASQDDSPAMTEASSVALLAHKHLLTRGGHKYEVKTLPQQKAIVLTGTYGYTAEAGGGW